METTKTQKIVLIESGENRGTLSPKCFLENFSGDLTEKTMRFINADWDQKIEVNLYSVVDVTMPVWMNEADYLQYYIGLRFAQIQYSEIINWDRMQVLNFISLGENYQYFVGWLLTKHKNTKNSFMQSIKENVQDWLNEEQHKYNRPLSDKQFESASKYCPIYKAKQLSTSLYYSFSSTY